MPRGHHNGKRGRKPLPPRERAARRLAATRRAARKWWKKNAIAQNEKRRQVEVIAKRLRASHGLHVAGRTSLDKPRLLWIDANGKIAIEEELSAEELIRRWKEANR